MYPSTAATGVVNVYQSGQPVTVTVTSTIAHPGWWRISLRQGAASSQNATNFPEPPEMGAPNSALQCTPPFIDNPVWSPTQPVIADKLGLPAGATATIAMMTTQSGTQTYHVTIPQNAQCSMASPCTLQVLMIMTDHVFPNCNYHHCANMALAGSTSDGGVVDSGGAAAGSGGSTGGGEGGSSSADGSAGSGGSSDKGCSCAVGGGAIGSWSGLIFLAALVLRRRRRK